MKFRKSFSRFSLRVLFVAVTLLCVLCAWVARRLHVARAQANAVVRLTSDRASPHYDYEFVRNPEGDWKLITNKDPRCRPSWFASAIPLLGVDFFHNVVDVTYHTPDSATPDTLRNANREVLEAVRTLPSLRRLCVDQTAITPRDLLDLPCRETLETLQIMYGNCDEETLVAARSFPRLTFFQCYADKLTPRGMQVLGQVSSLETIRLIAPLNDAHVAELVRCSRLRYLSVDKAGEVTRAGWRALNKLPNLRRVEAKNVRDADELCRVLGLLGTIESLELEDADLTDHGLAELSSLKNLHSLSLQDLPNLTGEGFPAPSLWPALYFLAIERAPISNAGLIRVSRYPRMRTLYLEGSAVTDEGICGTEWGPAFQDFHSRDIELGDAGLRHLAGLQSIFEIDFRNNRYHEEVRQEILTASPKLHVSEPGRADRPPRPKSRIRLRGS